MVNIRVETLLPLSGGINNLRMSGLRLRLLLELPGIRFSQGFGEDRDSRNGLLEGVLGGRPLP